MMPMNEENQSNEQITLASTSSMRVSLEDLRNGRAGLNQDRKSLLNRVPEIGDVAFFRVNRVEIEDLAYLSAAVNHEFALLRSKHTDILFHGQATMCIFSEALMELVESGKYELVAHSHPDYGPVIPSAEDRLFLKLIGQKTSKIISFITGEIRDYSAERFEDL